MAGQQPIPTTIYLVISPYNLAANPQVAYTDLETAREAAHVGGCTVSPGLLYHDVYVLTLVAHPVHALTSSQRPVYRTQR